MNNDRRKKLAALAERLEDLKADIEALREEEQEAFDNLPEGLQQGEKGEAMEAAITALDDAVDGLDTVVESLEEARA